MLYQTEQFGDSLISYRFLCIFFLARVLCIPDYQIHVLDVCHTPDDRLLEFPKDIATMFLTIKYRDNLPTLKKVLKAIPEIENIEEDTYDVMWNFLDKRMLELKENVQNEDGGINMCGAVDQMIAEGDI